MQTDGRIELQNSYRWLLEKFPFLRRRRLTIDFRAQKTEVLCDGEGNKVLRLKIFHVKLGSKDQLYATVDNIHTNEALGKEPRRCRVFDSRGEEFTVLGIDSRTRKACRNQAFENRLNDVAFIVSRWRDSENTQQVICGDQTTLMILIKITR